MGCCAASGTGDDLNRDVQRELNEAKTKDKRTRKVLLLGAGGSGKTTLFKQLQNIHGGGFSDQDRCSYISKIHEQIVEAMKVMVEKSNQYYGSDPQNNGKFKILAKNEEAATFVEGIPISGVIITPPMAVHIKNLWQDPAILETFNVRNKICVPDSTKHYLDNIDRLIQSDYIPSDDDLLLVRYRTTGMTEKAFVINNTTVRIVDVGGQRNERRKWIHHFDGVTAVIFVAALSCYDEVPFEDEDGNNMTESLTVFADQCNSPTFTETPFILFLNKKDVFEDKIKRVPLTVCFPEYKGASTYDEALDFIEKQFQLANINQDRSIYIHVTCATDVTNIQKVFRDIEYIILSDSLTRSGIL